MLNPDEMFRFALTSKEHVVANKIKRKTNFPQVRRKFCTTAKDKIRHNIL